MASVATVTVFAAVTAIASVATVAAPLHAQVAPPPAAPPAPPDTIPVGIPYLDDLTADGNLAEWSAIEPILLAPGAAGVEARGEFAGEDDLAVRVYVAWNGTGVYLAVRWRDDVLDTERLSREEARWTDPTSGTPLSRMLYSDDLAVALIWNDQAFTAWQAPRTELPLQWAQVRIGPRGGGAEVTDVEPEVVAKVDPEDGRSIVMELRLGWTALQRPPPFFEGAELRFIAADGDLPGASIEDRNAHVSYITWSVPIRLLPRP